MQETPPITIILYEGFLGCILIRINTRNKPFPGPLATIGIAWLENHAQIIFQKSSPNKWQGNLTMLLLDLCQLAYQTERSRPLLSSSTTTVWRCTHNWTVYIGAPSLMPPKGWLLKKLKLLTWKILLSSTNVKSLTQWWWSFLRKIPQILRYS